MTYLVQVYPNKTSKLCQNDVQIRSIETVFTLKMLDIFVDILEETKTIIG